MKNKLDEIINNNINLILNEIIGGGVINEGPVGNFLGKTAGWVKNQVSDFKNSVQNGYKTERQKDPNYHGHQQSEQGNNQQNTQNTNQEDERNFVQKFNDWAANKYRQRITKIYRKFQKNRPDYYKKYQRYFDDIYNDYISYDIFTIEDFKNGINGFAEKLYGSRKQNIKNNELILGRDDKQIDEIIYNFNDYVFTKQKIQGVNFVYVIVADKIKVYVYDISDLNPSNANFSNKQEVYNYLKNGGQNITI